MTVSACKARVVIWLMAFGLATGATSACRAAEPAPKTRPPGVAGSFYPEDASALAAMVDGLLAQAKVNISDGELVALISPHAGYQFSGAVAAHSYALLKGRKIHRVVLIAPSHFEAFDFSSVYDGDAYSTPLGSVPVDKEFARKLVAESSLIKLSSRGHAPSADGVEHSLEVQLPFLQRTLGGFELVPIIMGDQSYQASRALGLVLAQLVRGTDTLIVASSDLSHYHPYDNAVMLDHKALNAVRDWDYLTLSKNFQARTWEACGGGPIVAAMIAADRLGATRADLLKYANSGEVTSDRTRVVGYGAVALVRSTARQASQLGKFTLNARSKKILLDIAQRSVEAAVKDHKLPELPKDLPEDLIQDRGAFVTLTIRGELRGCVGYTTAMQSLASTVRDVAAFAAVQDSRFPPVTPGELPQLSYEISVLSPLLRVGDVSQIKVGEHGLLIKKGPREGLFLPQVALEQHWDRKTLLEEIGIKAGLPPSAWRDPESDLFAFTAFVFGDSQSPTGPDDSLLPTLPKPPGDPRSGLSPR